MPRDFQYALRILGRSPAFTLLSVAAIALGIGANTALFSIVRAVILQPLPFSEPERLVMVWETRPDLGSRSNVVSNANYLDWKARNQVFDAMSPMFNGTASLNVTGEPEEIRTLMVGEEFFPMLGASMQLGRGFAAEECKPGAPLTAILSDSLWRAKFGADRGVIGRTIRLGADAVTVIGVAPPDLLAISFRNPVLWRNARLSGTNANGSRSSGRNMAVLARLKRGITPEQADGHMVGLAKQLERDYPQFNAKWSARVVPLTEEMTGLVRTPLFFLLGAVGCVLLIACSNVANLLLIRAAGRMRELAVRMSLGATRGALIRQLLAESLTLAALGAAVGIPLGWWLLEVLKIYGPQDIRRLDRSTLDAGVLGFTVALTLLTGLLVGLAPALSATRQTLGIAMRDGARGATASWRTNLLRDGFTVVEVALSLILLVGAGLLLKSFAKLTAVEPGFRSDRVLTANISLPGDRYRDQKGVQFFTELGRRARAIPGVVNASNITFLPFKGPGSGTYFWRDDHPKPAPGQEPVTDVRMIQPGYFETMNIPLRRGRTFTGADNDAKAPLRFVVNDTMARTMFPGEEPIGRRLIVQMKAENLPGEIIGVTGDVKHGGLDSKARPMVYYPQAQLFFNFGTVVLQTESDPLQLAKPLANLIHEMDPELAIAEVAAMQRWIDDSVARPRFQTRLLAAFAGLALVLAIIGIYGVVSYGVAQRTHEIGVRMALGAQRGDVARMVLGRGARLAAAGLLIGIAGALALGRFLETQLYEVKATDPLTLTMMAALLLIVALGASYFPARRAARVDPMHCLRYE
ncbi:MAG: ABC transporter permease [Acidobacteria bacterium]|nr:ABC transporter permease [Acidobacteriota bacterium]